MKEETDNGLLGCYTDRQGNVEAVLGFRREQLLYDIRNYAYIEGHVMQTEDTHQRHTVQDVGEEGNVDRMTRVIDLAVTQCKEFMYPFTRYEVSNHELDDALKEQSVYGIVLSLPHDFSQTTVNLLERLVHEYIVCTAVADWMSITNPQKTETWAAKAEDMKKQIRTSLHSRRHKVRRRMSTFP